MVHKLLIDVGVSVDPKYIPLLSDFEIVRGIKTTFRFRIINIGKTTFPGGKLEGGAIIFQKLMPMFSFEEFATIEQVEIPKLKPKQEHIFITNFSARISGAHVIKMKIESNDKSKIGYYQVEKGHPLDKEWYTVMNVLDRERLDQILLLKKLLEKGK